MPVKIFTSFDDGNKLDIKVAQLLLEYKLPGIFFIPNQSPRTDIKPEEIKFLTDAGFEVGGHTKTHPADMKLLSFEKQVEEISYNRGWLQGLTGQSVDWFSYPRGRYNEDTIKAVKMAGFKFARTTIVGEVYEPKNNFRIDTSAHIYQRKEYDGLDWLDYAEAKFLQAKELNGVYHLWGHSEEINRFNYWEKFEELLKFIYDNR